MKALLAAIATLLISNAQAGIILIDFNDQTPVPFVFNNLTTQGFRLSPNAHYQIVDGPSSFFNPHTSNWIGWDGTGFNPVHGGPNPHYLGPPIERDPFGSLIPSLWIDFNGAPFSLLELETVSLQGSGSLLQFTSSNGGDLSARGESHVSFSGTEWTNVSWVLVDNPNHGGVASGFDNLTLRVADGPQGLPEPATVWLIGLAGLMFRALRHKKKVQT